MGREPAFIELQRAFTAHLRDPARHAAPGAHEDRRMAIYRYAIYANIERFMRDNYPRIHAIMDATRWEALVRDYLVRHEARATAFVELPQEFLDYLANERDAADDPPFLGELAHFDWLETLVGADQRVVSLDGIDVEGDLLDGVPVPNPVLRLVTYRYPVHAIDAAYQPDAPPPTVTRIAAFRDLEQRYGFLDLNAAAAALLESILERRGLSGRALIHAMAEALGAHDLAALEAAGGTILARMQTRGAILGTERGTR